MNEQRIANGCLCLFVAICGAAIVYFIGALFGYWSLP